MNIPEVVAALIQAQNRSDSMAYANCFSETATVADEGHSYQGREAIGQWIAQANEKYQATMKPLGYELAEGGPVLTTEIAGSFPGSPIVLRYHFQITDGQIDSLRII